MGFCSGMARFFLFFFNVIFWLSGLAILGLGIWFLVDDNITRKMEILEVDVTDKSFKYAAYLFIAFGAFVAIVGFAGCCGAIRKSKCLLGLYIFLMVIIMGGEIAAAVLTIIYQGEIKDNVATELKKKLKDDYGVPLSNGEASSFTKEFDDLQKELACCGWKGRVDFDVSEWKTNGTLNDGYVYPAKCCEDPANCKLAVPVTYDKGCEQGLLDWFDSKVIIIIGVGFGLAALEIFGFVAAICLCRQADREKY